MLRDDDMSSAAQRVFAIFSSDCHSNSNRIMKRQRNSEQRFLSCFQSHTKTTEIQKKRFYPWLSPWHFSGNKSWQELAWTIRNWLVLFVTQLQSPTFRWEVHCFLFLRSSVERLESAKSLERTCSVLSTKELNRTGLLICCPDSAASHFAFFSVR